MEEQVDESPVRVDDDEKEMYSSTSDGISVEEDNNVPMPVQTSKFQKGLDALVQEYEENVDMEYMIKNAKKMSDFDSTNPDIIGELKMMVNGDNSLPEIIEQ